MRKWLLLLLLLLALCLGPPVYRWMKDCSRWPVMDTVEYWMMVHEGCCYEILETRDEHICLAVQGDHDQWHYQVDRKFLTREVQEASYRRVVQDSIAWLKKELAHRNDPDPRARTYAQQGIKTSTERLQRYTRRYFEDPEDWIRWWEKNHERLRLSRDGERVVVTGY
jgi:hypothetical protein